MIRIIISLFLALTISGCDILCEDCSNPMQPEETYCDTDCYLDVNAPLQMDENGIYQMYYIPGTNQTFATLNAETGSIENYQKVGWTSNKEVLVTTHNGDYWVNCVNGSSYTDEMGEAHTVLAVWEVLVGDTITVYSGYTDECNNYHNDSLKVQILMGE